MADTKNAKHGKKKARKNSNYKTVVKYVDIDQLLKKALCDYRNMPQPDPEFGQRPEVVQNKYEKCVRFCTVAQVITKEERDLLFEGKNHVPMSAEEQAEFTGIPVYQIEKNEFAFKAGKPEDFVRASMVRLALCDMINEVISKTDPEQDIDTDNPLLEEAACYINFCLENGIITQDQALTIYVQVKQKQELDIPFVAGLTGLGVDVLTQMAQS